MRILLGAGAGLAALALAAPPTTAVRDPLAFFMVGGSLSQSDREALQAGSAWADVLPADAQEVAIVATSQVHASRDRLLAWIQAPERFLQGRYVLEARRFSKEPRLEDLDRLALDEKDLDDIRACRPGKCGLKLNAREIATLRGVAASGGAAWQDAVQKTFREIVLARAREYLASGYAAGAVYDDRSTAVRLDAEFASILQRFAFLHLNLPRFAGYLAAYPRAGNEYPESFLYWSKDSIAGRPIISITHVSVARGDGVHAPSVLIASKQVFATHYMNGSLAFTALTEGDDRTPAYLTYLNRSHVDIFDGPVGGVVRWILRRRVRDEIPKVLDELRRRLESGDPPGRQGPGTA
jgi:hypothetical protein